MKDAKTLDPLFVIFEKYLYDFPNDDLDIFIETIVTEYMGYLARHSVIVPEANKPHLLKDLADEVYDMYVKKLHGCLNMKDYRYNGRVTKLEKLRARDLYEKLTGTEG